MNLKGATSDYACVWYKIHKIQRWDMTKDALQLEVQQQALHHCEREKRKYEKQNNHWDSGIVESRKKRMHSKDGASAGEPESEASVVKQC